MKITSATYVKSALRSQQYPNDGRPEFAFVGRSNVGKSSLLNCLLRKKKLAKTSGTPGKTQAINFFEVNGAIYFVDLPGYGYAKVPTAVKQEWQRVMTAYLADRDPLRMVVLLLDARRVPSALDAQMLELLDTAEVATLIAATKIDKLKRSQRGKSIRTIRETLHLDPDVRIIPFSSVTGEGHKGVWRIVNDMVD